LLMALFHKRLLPDSFRKAGDQLSILETGA